MPLVGIVEYRRAIARAVRRERRNYDQPIRAGVVDIDVSIFEGGFEDEQATGVDSEEHRRLACEARAEFWRNVRAGEFSNSEDDAQTFEEWSHTE